MEKPRGPSPKSENLVIRWARTKSKDSNTVYPSWETCVEGAGSCAPVTETLTMDGFEELRLTCAKAGTTRRRLCLGVVI